MFKTFAVCSIMILFVSIPVNATIYLDLETIDSSAVDLTNTPVADVYYASMDIYVGNQPNWGGLSLYSGTNGTGSEMLLIGFDPGGDEFGVKNKQNGDPWTDVIDYVAGETYHLILEVNRVDQTIKLWIDNGDFDAPDYSGPPEGGASGSGNEFQAPLSVWCFVGLWGATGEYSNVLISDSAEDHFILKSPGVASNPNPVNETENIPTDVVLTWTPGDFADKHDVYLGTDFNDVYAADAGSPLLAGPAHDANSFNAGRLEFDQKYFWRVDEINAPPNVDTVFKGDVWSFTVEPIAYPILGDNITATASSFSEDESPHEPERTIDGSGMVGDEHSKNIDHMWLTDSGDPGPAWIQYEFDKLYKLHDMLVWNYNGPSALRFSGIKDVTVEYSTDGTNWTQLEGVSEFTQAPGSSNYDAYITVPFDDVAVQYVKINAISNWSGGIFTDYGLSEVRFLYIPVSAREPNPADEATDVAIDATLSWRVGREAAEHNVYLSMDEKAVIDGTAPVISVNQNRYSPPTLDLGKTYYWRVDEVNNAETPAIWPGNTWSLTTSESLMVDDFESYNDIPEGQEGSNLVYLTWIDGFDNPSTNGSTMGYTSGKSMETTIVHGGGQSAPVMYDNTVAQFSETTVNTSQLAVGRNWTVGAPEALVLWIYGDPNNAATDQMYVRVNNSKVVYTGDLTQTEWQDWPIDLASLGINLNSVTTLTIGFERTGATGGSGTVFVDDIRLYLPQ